MRRPGAGDSEFPGTAVVEVADVDGTRAVGAAVASVLAAGDLVVLSGDLGAGKTVLVQGLAAAAGCTGDVTSPTYTLIQHYATGSGYVLLHVDLYRLERLDEVIELAIPELLEEGAAAVVEWGERGLAALPPDYLAVDIEAGPGEGQRRIRLEAVGAAWEDKWEQLCAALGATVP